MLTSEKIHSLGRMLLYLFYLLIPYLNFNEILNNLSKALKETLGTFEKKGKTKDAQHFVSEKATITSAVGHLVELKMPTGSNGKKLPWNFNVLPSIPQQFELQAIDKTEGRVKQVEKVS